MTPEARRLAVEILASAVFLFVFLTAGEWFLGDLSVLAAAGRAAVAVALSAAFLGFVAALALAAELLGSRFFGGED